MELPRVILKLPFRLLPLLLILAVSKGISQKKGPDPHYKLIGTTNFIQSKNYYLLTLFGELPDVKRMIAADSVFSAIATNKSNALAAALEKCGGEGPCLTAAVKFTEQDIKLVGERLRKLYKPGNALGSLVKNHLVVSGAYILFGDLPPEEMLASAWMQDAEGVNYAIAVYAEGNRPNYPNIDSISFKTHEPGNSNVYLKNYVNLLYNTVSLVAIESRLNRSFFNIPLTAALRFIEINERDQAADYEPMTEGENKAAFDRIKTVDWKKYKYSVIMVPGAGPEDPEVALSAEGMLRCRLAAIRYHEGLAPFILTSGGKVHPYKTKYCEAVEMKQYLIKKLNVPAGAVFIDPHARHTTTNMRNTARLIYRYGIPFNKMAITCTTRGQSTMIERTLTERCIKELNEVPYKNGTRLSETEMEFYPLAEALQINPKEPLDP